MDIKRDTALNGIRALFNTERLAVLSTQKYGQPYASLVAYSVTEDLKQIIFLTPSTTRKFENLIANPKVAILVNNSRNRAEDIYNAVSLTVIGTAGIVDGDDKKKFSDLYLDRHPHLKDFSMAPTTAWVSVDVRRYLMVNRFQNVIEIGMTP